MLYSFFILKPDLNILYITAGCKLDWSENTVFIAERGSCDLISLAVGKLLICIPLQCSGKGI